jgi:CheY-like chemotaxis protein
MTAPNKNILVVDDLSTQRLLLARILPRFGYTIIEAGSWEETIELVMNTQQKIDCILMNIQMRGMDGYKTTGKLRALGYKMPIIGIGCNETPNPLPEWIQDYIRKPLDSLRLVEQIETALIISETLEKSWQK